ncbi:MAG: TlpA disulfide reductase family protein [Microthrixaceae bacterium]
MRGDARHIARVPGLGHPVPVALLAVALVLVGPSCSGVDSTASKAGVDRRSAPGLDGGRVELTTPGRPTVVAYIASWCAPCRKELPELEALVRRRAGAVRVVGVAMQEEASSTRGLVAETGITFEVARDPDGERFAADGFVAMPGTVLYDRDGRAVHRYRGPIDFADLDRRLDALTR